MLKFVSIAIIFIITFTFILADEDKKYWKEIGQRDILDAISLKRNEGIAKNVILFVGDGMGLTTITASRIYGPSEKGFLSFEKYPNIGTLKTYSANKYVPDSCSSATAMFSGVKANHKTSGVDNSVHEDDCEASLNPEAQLDSIFDWAQNAKKSTGFVTTTRVTHATPSALYSHVPNRKWECEQTIPEKSKNKCKDIARQLIEDSPGRNIKVIMGGGRQCLQSNVTGSELDPIDTWSCYSSDGRDLIRDWEINKENMNVKHSVVFNNAELWKLDYSNVDYLLGIFANGHMRMKHEQDPGPLGSPSLSEMVLTAYEILKKNHEGFFLMVEGGLIDQAHHRGKVRQALSETIEFSNAVQNLTDRLALEDNLRDTLIIVTSDHSHSLVFAGYADRSTGVLGIAQKSKIDDIPYTSLLYGTGGPDNFQYYVNNENLVERKNPELSNDLTDYSYVPQAGILTDEVTHDGTDVLIYATGPMSHLFYTVHEQTYVAYAIAFASKVGPFTVNDGICIICGNTYLYVTYSIIILFKIF